MQELNYICSGDYYIPNIRLPEENRPIVRWGRMHRDYLKEYHPIRFNTLCLSGELWTYLADLNEQAPLLYLLPFKYIDIRNLHFITKFDKFFQKNLPALSFFSKRVFYCSLTLFSKLRLSEKALFSHIKIAEPSYLSVMWLMFLIPYP